MYDTNNFYGFLSSFDENEREGRSRRLSFVVENFGDERDMFLPGMAFHYFNEIKICFIYGAFLSCLIVTLAALEDSLKFFYDPETAYKELAKIGLKDLVSRAMDDGYISREEGDTIQELRRYRNFYVHSKRCTRPESFMNRLEARAFNITKEQLIREDAERAVKLFFGLLKKPNFSPRL